MDLKAVKRRELAAWMQERFKVSVRWVFWLSISPTVGPSGAVRV